MPIHSSGLLLFRRRSSDIEVFLVHPGGPFWAKKDAAAWSIPKGVVNGDEDLLAAARREFAEETGIALTQDAAEFIPLSPVKQRGNKIVHAFALEVGDDFDAGEIRSNMFAIEWPPRSGRQQEFPEVDRAEWFCLAVAAEKIHLGQRELLEQLRALVTPRP